jgi:uncharacterized membrane protein
MKMTSKLIVILLLMVMVAFLHDWITFRNGMIEYREEIQKWREVSRSISDRVWRSTLFSCAFVGFCAVIWHIRTLSEKRLSEKQDNSR